MAGCCGGPRNGSRSAIPPPHAGPAATGGTVRPGCATALTARTTSHTAPRSRSRRRSCVCAGAQDRPGVPGRPLRHRRLHRAPHPEPPPPPGPVNCAYLQPPWTTTRVWPIPKTCPTKPPPPAPASSPVPPPGSPPRASPSNASDRQRRGLHQEHLAPDLRRAGRHPSLDPALAATHQRQGRTLPPHPALRVGSATAGNAATASTTPFRPSPASTTSPLPRDRTVSQTRFDLPEMGLLQHPFRPGSRQLVVHGLCRHSPCGSAASDSERSQWSLTHFP